MKFLRFLLLFLLFSASIGVVFVAITSGQAGGGNIFCRDVFPGSCTQGGCGAQSGWTGQDCVIYCTRNSNGTWNTITCEKPPAV